MSYHKIVGIRDLRAREFGSETVGGFNGKEKACRRLLAAAGIDPSASKMPRCKGPPGVAFEIFLKGHSLLVRAKCDRCLNFPRTMFGCTGNLSRIVGFETTL
jgi:hypothetical protein